MLAVIDLSPYVGDRDSYDITNWYSKRGQLMEEWEGGGGGG